jgi:hypothetical protein
VHCLDTDPVKAMFAQYRPLQAKHIKVLRRIAFNDKRFGMLINKICRVLLWR